MSVWSIALRAFIAFVALLLIPGWTWLALTGLWRRWQSLTLWLVAVSFSLALFPVGFYIHRALMSWLPLGPYKLSALLVLAAGFTVWRLRAVWRELLHFDALDGLAVLILAATLFTRFWIIRYYPYPAWSDSLHHTLLTDLTATQGHLPFTLEPYAPTPLNMYHLGLYSLSAAVAWLAQVPAHTALLWTAQVINGLCGIGLYLLLAQRVGRVGALVGLAFAGLWSHQPSYYVNWGRFTQLAGQTLLLSAAAVSWDVLENWCQPEGRRSALSLVASAALLSAAVFLYHFRVAAFYLPLLFLLALSVGWSAWRQGQGMRYLARVALLGILGLLFVSPALGAALRAYIASVSVPVEAQFSEDFVTYFTFPLTAIPILGLRPPLLWLAGGAALIGLAFRKGMSALALLWTALLMALGYAYLVPWRFLHLTNLGAIVIMLYLPAAWLVGVGAQSLADWLDARRKGLGSGIVLILTLVGILAWSGPRLREIEIKRHFVTPADVVAMAWIEANTPQEALFAINTYTWMRSVPHGIDGGYWISYFTKRHTTTGTMLSSLGPREHALRIVELSTLTVQLDASPQSAAALRQAGVDYVYVGPRHFTAPTAWDEAALAANPALELVYDHDGVRIYRIHD